MPVVLLMCAGSAAVLMAFVSQTCKDGDHLMKSVCGARLQSVATVVAARVQRVVCSTCISTLSHGQCDVLAWHLQHS
jgi:hypothetical protein